MLLLKTRFRSDCFRFTTQCAALPVFEVRDIAPMVTDLKTVVEGLPQEVPGVLWEVSVSDASPDVGVGWG